MNCGSCFAGIPARMFDWGVKVCVVVGDDITALRLEHIRAKHRAILAFVRSRRICWRACDALFVYQTGAQLEFAQPLSNPLRGLTGIRSMEALTYLRIFIEFDSTVGVEVARAGIVVCYAHRGGRWALTRSWIGAAVHGAAIDAIYIVSAEARTSQKVKLRLTQGWSPSLERMRINEPHVTISPRSTQGGRWGSGHSVGCTRAFDSLASLGIVGRRQGHSLRQPCRAVEGVG